MPLDSAVPITDFLYLGSFSALAKESFLKDNGIRHIVNASIVVPDCQRSYLKTLRIDVEDRPTSNIAKYFECVSDFIEEKHRKGEKVFVHCVAGVSRSPTLVIAYLMKHQKLPLMDAHALVKSKRQIIRPNSGFWSQLVEYEKTLFNENTVTMVSSPLGAVPSIYEAEVRNMVW